MNVIQDIIAELKRILEKPPAEQEIAMRLIETSCLAKLSELEKMAQESVVKAIDDMVVDCISVPGAPSEFEKKSHQDVLVTLKNRFAQRISTFDPVKVTTAQVVQRASTRKPLNQRFRGHA